MNKAVVVSPKLFLAGNTGSGPYCKQDNNWVNTDW